MAVMLLTRGPRNCSCSYLFQCSQFWCPENGGLPILQPQLFLVLQTALLWTLYWPVNKKITIRMLYLESVVERVYFGRWLWGQGGKHRSCLEYCALCNSQTMPCDLPNAKRNYIWLECEFAQKTNL